MITGDGGSVAVASFFSLQPLKSTVPMASQGAPLGKFIGGDHVLGIITGAVNGILPERADPGASRNCPVFLRYNKVVTPVFTGVN